MKLLIEQMSMAELDKVSGGYYSEYVEISNAIAKRIGEINKQDPSFAGRTERLNKAETIAWLKANLEIGADFKYSVGFKPLDKVCNNPAVYYSVASTSAGQLMSHADVIKRIANWTPKK